MVERGPTIREAIPLGTRNIAMNIIMVCRGHMSETLEAVRALLANTVSTSNILLWDDRSDDNTADTLKAVEGFDGRVVCCDSPKRKGLEFAARAMFELFPGPPMVAMVRQDAAMKHGWDARMVWIYRQLWPHGALAARWEREPEGAGHKLTLADTPGKPQVLMKNSVGYLPQYRGHRLTRDECPAVVVSSEVFRKHAIPEDLSVRFEMMGRPVAVALSVEARRTGKSILVAGA